MERVARDEAALAMVAASSAYPCHPYPSSAYRAHLEIEATLTFKTDAVRRMLPK
jgi:hypothetical protein